MNYERFRHGIGVLQRVAIEHLPYDHRFWVADESDPYDCGTAACSAGWLARDAWIKAEGLLLVAEEVDDTPIPTYRDATDFEALADFFDISEDEAEDLFALHPEAMETVEVIISRMEKMLADHLAAVGRAA